MTRQTLERLFDPRDALEHPVTRFILAGVVLALLIAPVIINVVGKLGTSQARACNDLWLKYRSWLVLAPLLTAPILLGAAWTITAIGGLSLLCFHEFARATRLYRERAISITVLVGILALTFAVFDHWYGLFVALVPLGAIMLATVGIFADSPRGYIHRVALGTLAFLLFGSCLGHLGYMANSADYRPIILTVLLCVEMNDVFAFIVGKLMGGPKLAPHTSPNKTIAGSLGALVLTTALFIIIGRLLFADSHLTGMEHLIALGVIISVAGQLGDLVMSSIKRDLNIKDLGGVLPGHGGLLDRFDSLILVSPAVYHYVGYQIGFGLDQPTRILTGP